MRVGPGAALPLRRRAGPLRSTEGVGLVDGWRMEGGWLSCRWEVAPQGPPTAGVV